MQLNGQKIFKILITFLMLQMVLWLSSCHPLKPFSDVETADATKLIKSKQNSVKFIILDVRTPEEFATGFIAGAINLDFKSAEFAGKLDGLDKSKTYLVYCRAGGRSAKAMAMMKEKGFERVYNLRGGITEWNAQKLPLKNQ
jgi:rhodanese-related sulfurtransferase